MVLELHVWGSKTQISSFDAESIASAKYLSLMCEPYGYIVIPSSNTDISPTGKLPALRDGEVVIGGYYNIVKYLKETGKDLDSWMTPKQRSQNTALLFFIQENISALTLYTLFLNRQNYEGFSRGHFIQFLPFPMQYNAPLEQRSYAKSQCSKIGLAIESKKTVTYDITKDLPALTKLHATQQQKRITEVMEQRGSKTTIKCMNYAIEFYQTVLDLKKSSGAKFCFGNELSSSDLLLESHFLAQTDDRLPDQFLKPFLKTNLPSLVELCEHIESITCLDYLGTGDVEPADIPSLWNSIGSRLNWLMT